GRWVASAAGDWRRPPEQPGEVHIWEFPSGRLVHALKAHRGVAWSVAFSPDGTRLASSGGEDSDRDDHVILWDVATGQPLRRFPCPRGGSHCVSFSPDGTRLTAASGTAIQSWLVETGELLFVHTQHTGIVSRIGFNRDHSRAFSGGFDKLLG